MGELEKFLKFPSLGSFKNTAHYFKKMAFAAPEHQVWAHYRGKPKLHGTNAAIRVFPASKHNVSYDVVPPIVTSTGSYMPIPDSPVVVAQSRKHVLDIHHDNYEFADWVNRIKADFLKKVRYPVSDEFHCLNFFGEWAGVDINSGDAICEAPRAFHIFMVVMQDEDGNISKVEVDPDNIKHHYLGEAIERDDIFVIPWMTPEIVLNVSNISSSGQELDHINQLVEMAAERCAYTEKLFGIEGRGEGFVYYPTYMETSAEGAKAITMLSHTEGLLNWCGNMMFKAKAEHHSERKGSKPVSVEPLVLEKQNEFVQMFCTDPRLEKAVVASELEYTLPNISEFIKYVCTDIYNETEIEREEAGVEWKPISKAIARYAGQWFRNKC